MLLGDLINKYKQLEDNVNGYQKSTEEMDLDGNRLNILINETFDDITKHYSYFYETLNFARNIKVNLNDSEDVTLFKVFMLRDITKRKLEFINTILYENSYNLDLESLLKERKTLTSNLQYLEGLINKTIWSVEIDSESLGQI